MEKRGGAGEPRGRAPRRKERRADEDGNDDPDDDDGGERAPRSGAADAPRLKDGWTEKCEWSDGRIDAWEEER